MADLKKDNFPTTSDIDGDSSDSIEVVDSEKNADTKSINTLTEGCEGVSPGTSTAPESSLTETLSPEKYKQLKKKDIIQIESNPSTSTMDTNADLMHKLLDDMSRQQIQTMPFEKANPYTQGLTYENIYESSDYPSGSNVQSEDELLGNLNSAINRPDSLSLPRPLQYYERQKKKSRTRKSESSNISNSSSVDALIEEVSKTPLTKQGTLTKNGGGMMEFIADDLNHMIKMSSPISQSSGASTPSARSSVSSSTSGWSSSSASGWSYSGMSRSPSILTASPEDIPPIDPRIVMDVEIQAQRVAGSLDHMLGTLRTNLHKMSALTVRCVGAYEEGVDATCESVDTAIKSMYAMMAKCEELSKSMEPVYGLHTQIRQIKRVLDIMETQVKDD